MTTPSTKLRRDAAASVFAYAIAGIALLLHVVTTVADDWFADDLVLAATNGEGRRTVTVAAAEVPDWAGTALRVADVVEWLAAATVLVTLAACVMGMIRGEVFTRTTARWATWSSWAAAALLLLPPVGRLPATNTALQSAPRPDTWDAGVLDGGWWYLYVGMMTLSFLALVLRRGCQMREDQDGLI